MLLSFHIENIAVIKSLDVDFLSGFIVLSGETGAGKSIIIDSINLILGAKPSRELIREGESRAMVSALFTGLDEPVVKQLEDLGIKTDGDETSLLIQRNISTDGKSSCRINGRAVTINLLKDVAKLLINIHGQHDTLLLLKTDEHINLLDNFAELDGLLEQYGSQYDKMTGIKAKINSLSQNEQEKRRMTDLLKYQLQDIESAKLKEGEEERLEELKLKIQNHEKINKAVTIIISALSDSERGTSAYERIGRAVSAITAIADFIPEAEEYISRLGEYQSEIMDIAERVRVIAGRESENPAAMLDKIESRLDQISRLKAKYGNSIKEVLLYKENLTAEMDNIIFAEEKITALNNELTGIMAELSVTAEQITAKRTEAAQLLRERVMRELGFLEMSKVVFDVRIDKQTENDGGVRYTPRGVDDVEFLIATNPGENPKPLIKIASGGELSRIMLALTAVLAVRGGIGTLIFDEIDTGISGGTAQKVGLKLKQISESRQVICVTHSAQIAALANQNLLIQKQESEGRAHTVIKQLDKEEKIAEVARIMGGVTITESVLSTAREMVENVQ